ncbi:MAG: VOC family protein [Acidobacteriota bacterium]
MILGIHHAQITIPAGAEEQARAFYCHVLGLCEIAKPHELAGRGGLWLEVGDRQVHIGTENGVVRSASKAHVAYLVDDLDSYRNMLATNGIEVIDGIQIPNSVRFEFRDPFGNRIEFIQAVTN